MTNAEYYQANKTRILAKQASYRKANRQVILSKKRQRWHLVGSDQRRQRRGLVPRDEYLAKIRTPDNQRQARRRLYKTVARVVRSSSKRINSFLGCSPLAFRLHIERLWSAGMTWENYGLFWEIDHVKPLASFDLSDRAQFLICAHFSNTRPLPCSENCKPNRG